MSDREQFMLRQAAKFDDMVKDELGMSANEALKAFSQGRLKGNNQQLQQAREEGKRQAAQECMQICDDLEAEGYHYEINNHAIVKDRIAAKFGLEG